MGLQYANLPNAPQGGHPHCNGWGGCCFDVYSALDYEVAKKKYQKFCDLFCLTIKIERLENPLLPMVKTGDFVQSQACANLCSTFIISWAMLVSNILA